MRWLLQLRLRSSLTPSHPQSPVLGPAAAQAGERSAAALQYLQDRTTALVVHSSVLLITASHTLNPHFISQGLAGSRGSCLECSEV